MNIKFNEPGKCPYCGGLTLPTAPIDATNADAVYHPVKCTKCKATIKEGYIASYIGFFDSDGGWHDVDEEHI